MYKNNLLCEDLIFDESFRKYAEKSDIPSIIFWEEWIQAHPENEQEVNKAREIVETLLNDRQDKLPADKNISLQKLLSEIEKTKDHRIFLVEIWKKIAAILILATGLSAIWLLSDKKQLLEEIQYNEIIVQPGQKSQVILPDGSHVWINGGSNFKYPVTFNQGTREVFLQGEAFFDVTKKEGLAFKVITHNADIMVLGTEFNVVSHPEDLETRMDVINGLVSINSKEKKIDPVLIKSNQAAILRKKPPSNSESTDSTNEITILDNVNASLMASWRENQLIFSDETFEEIAAKMELWYNVSILIADEELKQVRYAGKFIHNETINEVLEVIKATTPLNYSISNEQIVITR